MAAGFVMLLPCALLFYYYMRAKKLLDEMWAVKTYEAAELKRMCRDGFDATVEIQGAVTCDQPIISLAAQIPCCWYHIKVCQEQEKNSLADVAQADSRIVSGDDWVHDMDSCQSTLFKIEDRTGFTLVNPQGADIDTITVFDGVVTRDEPWFEKLMSGRSGRYHVTEEVFIPTGYAYVLGQASWRGDDVMIHAPAKGYIDPDEPFFVISRRTEEELTGYRGINVHVCFYSGIIALLASVLLILQGMGLIRLF